MTLVLAPVTHARHCAKSVGTVGITCSCGALPRITLTVPGPPATKKNSMKLIYSRKHQRIVPVPSDAYMDFEQRMKAAWLTQPCKKRVRMPVVLVNVEARVFLPVGFDHRHYGDASGYYDAIGDALQAAGIIEDDKLVESWDGSHRYTDPVNPRVEITITALNS